MAKLCPHGLVCLGGYRVGASALQTVSPSVPFVDAIADKQWYAVYTCAQHEKSVNQQIAAKGIESLLPATLIKRQWKDRVVKLETPLFPGYVFVRIHLDERVKVLSVPSVVRLVSFNGRPAPIESAEIESIRVCLANGSDVQTHPYIEIDQRVSIMRGPLQGVEGVLVRRDDDCRLVVAIHLLNQALSVEVDPADVQSA
jgi:transcription antitermination factor NusG